MARVIRYEGGNKVYQGCKDGEEVAGDGEENGETERERRSPNPLGPPQNERKEDTFLVLWPSGRSGDFRKPQTF